MKDLHAFYGEDIAQFSARRRDLEEFFTSYFGTPAQKLVSSSGRAEIIGNHTDHNGGRAIVSAISCDILCAVSPRTDGVIEIASKDYYPIRFSVNDLSLREEERGKSSSLARGVAQAVANMGYTFGGFSACTSGNIFRGAGVSSSAAFEVLIAEIINVLYLDGSLTPLQKAQAGQYAENVYFGKPCGLLDQAGVAFGGLQKVNFLRADEPSFERLPAPRGYSLVLTRVGKSHSTLTKHYADIRKEMSLVAQAMGKKVLGEVSAEEFWREMPRLSKKLKERSLLRAIHFFEENARVDRAASALLRGDSRGFLAQIRKSGESSLALLQNCYVPGSSEQPLALALKISERAIKDGAFRIQGGGFTGTVIAFVRSGQEEGYAHEMGRVFGKGNVFHAQLRERGASEIEI